MFHWKLIEKKNYFDDTKPMENHQKFETKKQKKSETIDQMTTESLKYIKYIMTTNKSLMNFMSNRIAMYLQDRYKKPFMLT